TPNVHSKCLTRERWLEDALAKITGEEQGVRPTSAKRSKKPQLSDADVLRLVHYRGIVRRRRAFRLAIGQSLKYCRLCHHAARLQPLADLLEDLPQNRSSGFWQTCAPAETLDVS